MNIKHLNVVIFCLTLIVLAGMNLLIPNANAKIEMENRMTTPMPEFSLQNLLSGEFFNKFEDYFADNFVMRNTYVSISKRIKSFNGLGIGDTVQIVEYQGVNVDEEVNVFSDEKQSNEQDASKKVTESQQGLQDSKWGKILIYNNAAMELNTFSEIAAKKYAESLNSYAERFPDIKVYSMIVPTQIEFIDNEQYRSLSVSQSKTIAKIQSFFNDKIIPVNIYNNLKAHSDEYIFFRTDHHWTQRGAFYGYQVFAEILGEKKPLLSDYKRTTYDGFLGSLYKVTMNEKLAKKPDHIELFDPQIHHKYYSLGKRIKYSEGKVFVRKWLKTEEKYGVYLGGDQPIVKIETNQKHGRNILVLKDSYANALVPFLMGVADNIIVIDPRLFDGKIDDIIVEHSITDILFVNYALITRGDGYSQLYNKLLK